MESRRSVSQGANTARGGGSIRARKPMAEVGQTPLILDIFIEHYKRDMHKFGCDDPCDWSSCEALTVVQKVIVANDLHPDAQAD